MNIDLHQTDYDKSTIMHIAASQEHFNVVKWLVKNKCGVNIKDRWQQTPLDLTKNEKIKEYLLNNGAKRGGN